MKLTVLSAFSLSLVATPVFGAETSLSFRGTRQLAGHMEEGSSDHMGSMEEGSSSGDAHMGGGGNMGEGGSEHMGGGGTIGGGEEWSKKKKSRESSRGESKKITRKSTVSKSSNSKSMTSESMTPKGTTSKSMTTRATAKSKVTKSTKSTSMTTKSTMDKSMASGSMISDSTKNSSKGKRSKSMKSRESAKSAKGMKGKQSEMTVEITNLSYQQPFGPFFIMTHNDEVPAIFELGSPASEELATLAEEGSPRPLATLYEEMPGVGYVDMHQEGAPYIGGGKTTFTVPYSEDYPYLSIASMAINTNDCFVALDYELMEPEGAFYSSSGWDAGTEENNELCSSIPGPACPADSGNERALNGEGFVHIHRGFFGVGDLSSSGYDWRNPMMFVMLSPSEEGSEDSASSMASFDDMPAGGGEEAPGSVDSMFTSAPNRGGFEGTPGGGRGGRPMFNESFDGFGMFNESFDGFPNRGGGGGAPGGGRGDGNGGRPFGNRTDASMFNESSPDDDRL